MENDYLKVKSKTVFGKNPNIVKKEMNHRTDPNLSIGQIGFSDPVPKSISVERLRKSQFKYLESKYWNTSKRSFDVIFSLFIVVFVLSWLCPLLYILIKLESKGPLLFIQKRNGLNQKFFDCYKFRSMEPNDYSESLATFKDDPRITGLGMILRKYNIDELPQFVNVLKGEMTIVGPRPHMLSETNSFNKLSSDFYKRHLVKPGITGLAQISNCRGEINSINDLTNRLKYDLFYIKNASLLYDFKIIYKTLLKMIFGDKKAR